jgi:hypothetical protein
MIVSDREKNAMTVHSERKTYALNTALGKRRLSQ